MTLELTILLKKEECVCVFFFLLQSQIRFVIAEGYKAKSAKEKGEWGGMKPRENQVQASKSLLPAGSRKTHIIPPAIKL